MIKGQLARELVELITDLNTWQIQLHNQPSQSEVRKAINIGLQMIEPYINETIEINGETKVIITNQSSYKE